MRISSYVHITSEYEGGSGWNGGSASASRGTTIHKDVVKVYDYILIEHIKEDLIYQPLEG